ncbi:hypothetical protein PR202_ga00018 [Eleusine coracana subsp. coracana]|uniref:Uncharacterized protein n=1 Tax=Eleusine coracana subsp. coracana TaxID=191504 RepID=A0AAV5BFX4_ELECO|nr:hypothetical protein PR202_ga00018 [Eleusine coracana subsp. coracana]
MGRFDRQEEVVATEPEGDEFEEQRRVVGQVPAEEGGVSDEATEAFARGGGADEVGGGVDLDEEPIQEVVGEGCQRSGRGAVADRLHQPLAGSSPCPASRVTCTRSQEPHLQAALMSAVREGGKPVPWPDLAMPGPNQCEASLARPATCLRADTLSVQPISAGIQRRPARHRLAV